MVRWRALTSTASTTTIPLHLRRHRQHGRRLAAAARRRHKLRPTSHVYPSSVSISRFVSSRCESALLWNDYILSHSSSIISSVSPSLFSLRSLFISHFFFPSICFVLGVEAFASLFFFDLSPSQTTHIARPCPRRSATA